MIACFWFLRPSLPPVVRRPTGESPCRCTTTGRFFRRHPTSCPPSTSTAPDRCHVPGHDKAAGLGETPRRHEKNTTSGGKADDPGNRLPGRGRLGRREQPAHEPLILRATLVAVPLTGLFLHPAAEGLRMTTNPRLMPESESTVFMAFHNRLAGTHTGG